jgi:hypothetical protein
VSWVVEECWELYTYDGILEHLHVDDGEIRNRSNGEFFYLGVCVEIHVETSHLTTWMLC